MAGIVGRQIGLDLDRPIGTVLRGLGFCRAGTADALNMLELQDRKYDTAELVSTINAAAIPRVAKKYPSETGTVAKLLAANVSRLPAAIAEKLQTAMA